MIDRFRKMIDRFLNWFWKPSSYAWGGILLAGGLGGIIFWGAFNTGMEGTNTLGFCRSCHEMESYLFEEYKETIHYENRTGVRATCSDCHVPDPWVYKLVRKVQASKELYHKAMGSISTPEKFEAKRLTLAKKVWKTMKKTDSRECRNCHSWDAMSSDLQKRRAQKKHIEAREEGMTCIDCHKGIAHRPVHKLLDEEVDNFYDGKPDDRQLPLLEKVAEAADNTQSTPAAPTQPAPATTTPAAATSSGSGSGSGGGSTDWSSIAPVSVTLFYPGQASWEWILKGSDHGGARAITKLNDRCAECHKGEEADMGAKIVSGEKAEPTPIPGKRGAIDMTVQAAHDGETMSLRFQWSDAGHTPAPLLMAARWIRRTRSSWPSCWMMARSRKPAILDAGPAVTMTLATCRINRMRLR